MQEKDKKPRRTWRGFESEDGITEYGVHFRGERVAITSVQEGAEDEEKGRIDMNLEDFKHLLAIAQEMLHASDSGAVRGIGITRE